jgi:hypothetical protein
MSTTRTKRRYAHELYPHPDEAEIRDLAVEVPYLLARAIGHDIDGTSWTEVEPPRAAGDRIEKYIQAAHIAFLADALLQGMSGQDAWQWATGRAVSDSIGEWLWERGTHYGVPVDQIKPYPCGPEPSRHDHYSNGTWGYATSIDMPESECPECTEPIEEPADVER